MKDKKLTDSEIKKALECCVGDNDGKNCFDCPLWEIDGCQERLLLDALDLINRPQAKNERLTTAHPKTIESIKKMRDKAKAEAVKEFAERLKDKHRRITDYDEAGFGAQIFIVEERVIDNILKKIGG